VVFLVIAGHGILGNYNRSVITEDIKDIYSPKYQLLPINISKYRKYAVIGIYR